MDNSGWWKAKKKIGNEYKIGWIPSNFVKLCKSIPNFNLNNENNNKQYNDVIEKDSLIIKQGYMIKVIIFFFMKVIIFFRKGILEEIGKQDILFLKKIL